MQYFVKTVSDSKGRIAFFNFGKDKHNKYRDTESYYGKSGISITVYKTDEYQEFREHYQDLLNDYNCALAIHI